MAWVKVYEDTEKRIDRDDVTGTERTVWANANYQTIRDQAAAALAANRTFIGRGTANTAIQVRDQTVALTRQMNGVIRILLNQLDGTD